VRFATRLGAYRRSKLGRLDARQRRSLDFNTFEGFTDNVDFF
jgi:hypothetical protein